MNESSNSTRLSEISRKRRLYYLAEKLRQGKHLTASEDAELRRYENARLPSGRPSSGIDRLVAHRERVAQERATQREVAIDFSRQDLQRRKQCREPKHFMRTYFPDIFYLPFSKDQQYLIDQIRDHIHQGGMKAIAAPRGGGKTTISKGMVIWGLVHGLIRWVPWIEANLEMAIDSLEDIKLYFEEPHGQDLFRDDFAEYCDPIRALDGEPRRARLQAYHGSRVKIVWGRDKILLPTIPAEHTPNNTPALGGIIQAFGAEKPIRGLVRQAIRPDFVMINDIETEETAKSLSMTENIKRNIEKAVKGLAGPGQKLGIVMLCTIIRWGCLADQFTDRNRFPQWQGDRQKLLSRFPDHPDLWDQYIYLRKKQQREGIKDTSEANGFYRSNRKAMDAGAVVSHRGWYDRSREISALQHAYNLIADMGLDNFRCELQNDPPIEIISQEQILPDRILEKINQVERGIVPLGVEKIVGFVDVHDQKLFWTIVGWKMGFIGSIVDYGVERVMSPVSGTVTKEDKDKQVEIAILDALQQFRQRIEQHGWMQQDGQNRQPNLMLIDAGYKPDPVYHFCRQVAGGRWLPAIGGSSRLGKYQTPKPSQTVRIFGPGIHQSWQPQPKMWLTILDADKWKRRVQDGFLVPKQEESGSISLFGSDPILHRAFAEHITSEAWSPEKQRYERVPGFAHNHWLDCMAGCCAAAQALGIRLIQSPKPPVPPQPKIRLSDQQREHQNRRTNFWLNLPPIRTQY